MLNFLRVLNMSLQRYSIEQDLPTAIPNWMHTRFLKEILDLVGGWEHWIQIDLPAWLDNTSGHQYDFQREATIHGFGKKRFDWLINAQQDPPIIPTVVEIKAQTPRYIDSVFISDVYRDFAKLSELGDGYKKYVLLAVMSPEIQKWCEARNFTALYIWRDQQGGDVAFFLSQQF